MENRSRPLLLDGALGSYLQIKGYPSDPIFWYSKFNFTNPEIIKSIHKEYLIAGAEIITTNTFRTNPTTFQKSKEKISWEDFVAISVSLAKDIINNEEIIIAGSNAPAEDCYQKERLISENQLQFNHKNHIDELWKNGVDIIWNETHSHIDEIEIIGKHCSSNAIPFAMNLYVQDDLTILSGEPINEVIEFVKSFHSTLIGFNCIKPEILFKYLEKYYLPENWGFYFNCGIGDVTDNELRCGISPIDYLKHVKELIKLKPKFIGSCCGSSPLHTKIIKEYLDEIYRN